ncbi:MAG: glycine cleavage system protein GcvH [Actinobacteria bacterium]|nr:glycine cleavage system protein GcvH [Actinomycetota bacterium]
MELPKDRRYSSEHEWAQENGGRIVVGITDYAQDQLGDVVYVGLPDDGAEVHAGQPFGEVESTKSVSDIYSPVSGVVVTTNGAVESNPELINSDPYGDGWLVVIEPADGQSLDALMDPSAYERQIGEGS